MGSTEGDQGTFGARQMHGASHCVAYARQFTDARLVYLWLAALAAALLFSAISSQQANATVTPSLTVGYSTSTAGGHPNVTQSIGFNTTNGDDPKRLVIDMPPGLIGDPNAVAAGNRCVDNYPEMNANGTPTGTSPDYSDCPASSKVGTVSAVANPSGLSALCGTISLNSSKNGIYHLRNKGGNPAGSPEVPTYLGIHIEGICTVLFIPIAAKLNITARITLRPDDGGLRIEVVDNLPSVDPILGNEIQILSMSQTIFGMAPSPSTRPFMTNPTRCNAPWVTTVATRAYQKNTSSNSNANVDLMPNSVNYGDAPSNAPDFYRASSSQNGSCSGLPAFSPTFSLTQSTTQAGAPVGIKAVMTNPVSYTSALQPPYPKEVEMNLPAGFKINPAVAQRLGSTGCTEAEFRRPVAPEATFPISDLAPLCPASSETGTVAVTVPEITGDLFGKVYLGNPKPGDTEAGIYRIYVYAKRGGLGIKFEGQATTNQQTGQISISVKNVTPFNAGLPQFNYSKFTMEFDTNSRGVGVDEFGNPISNPVYSPNDQQELITNPQVCGTYPAAINITPWTYPTQSVAALTSNLSVTAGKNGSCDFTPFNPSFSVSLTQDYDPAAAPGAPGSLEAAAPITGVGQSPTMTFKITRPDRMDNLKRLRFTMPEGFGGSIKAPPSSCSVASVAASSCGAGSKIGSVAVQTGSGDLPITISGDIHLMDRAGAELTDYTAKMAIIVPAVVGPFNLGSVVNKLYLRLASSSRFSLIAETDSDGLIESIRGIPVLYREIKIKLDGINKRGTADTSDDRAFLILPTKCNASLQFKGEITSAGNAPAAGPTTTYPTASPSPAATTNCAAQSFTPQVTITGLTSAPATPTGMTMQVQVPQTETGVTESTIQQSTINRVRMTMPAGFELNPAIANSITACPTSAINADIANPNANTNTCGSSYPTSKLGEVLVDTPLLPTSIAGTMYIEEQGSTAATRFRFVLYLALPGGQQIIRGGARIAGSTDSPPVGLGSTSETTNSTSIIDGAPLAPGQLEADFQGLPDVAYSSLKLIFNSSIPMFVTPSTCQVNNFRVRLDATNTSASTSPATSPAYKFFNTPGDPNTSFTTSGCPAQRDFKPTVSLSMSSTVANAHPNMTASIIRPDLNKDFKKAKLHLPAGLNGAATAAPTCSLANAAAANCTAASVVGSVAVEIGSGANVATISGGKIHNTATTSANEAARLTTIVPIVIGPFNLGKMTLPITAELRAGDVGLDSVVELPQRFEGIETHYRKLTIVLNGYADQGTVSTADDKPFLTNPSKCGTNVLTVDAWADDGTPASPSPTASFNTTGCPFGFPIGSLPTLTAVPTTTEAGAPTGLNVTVNNGTQTSFNPSIGAMRMDFPAGMTVNPAVGNDGANGVCSTALIDAGGASCPAASKRGTVEVVTPLLAGTFTGDVFLEQPGSTKETRFRLALIVQLPGQKLIIRGATLLSGSSDLSGPTGSVDTGTGVISAVFTGLPDVPFSSLKLSLAPGPRAVLVNPPTCGTQQVKATITPNSGTPQAPNSVDLLSSYSTTSANCAPTFAPTFDAAMSTTVSGGHPDLTLTINNPANSPQLRLFGMDLPAGLVADTVSTPRCSKAGAAAGNCPASTAIGTLTTTMGSPAGAETLTVAGKVYNVEPDTADEPARLQGIVPVVVGPFDLGKLSIPVKTSLRTDYGLRADTQLPYRYEGIDVRLRNVTMAIKGIADQGTVDTSDDKSFMINPSRCTTSPVSATLTSLEGAVVNRSKSFTFTGCPREFPNTPQIPKPAVQVTPTTTETGVPTGLKMVITNSIENPTLQRIALEMPDGMELNPGVGEGLVACTPAQIDAGARDCESTTANLGTVALETPLLAGPQTGNVFLESPKGNDKDTRYRVAIVVHLPGKDLIVRGRVTLDGSTTIPTGGTGATNTGTGKLRAVFYGESDSEPIPDLGYTKMTVDFGSGPRAMFTNPRACTSATFKGTFSPHGGGADATATSSYTTTLDCGTPAFAPTFDATATPANSAGNPEIALSATRAAKDRNLVGFDIDLPTGMVASTGNVPRCGVTAAAEGNCDPESDVGDASAKIGGGSNPFTISGDVFNVAPLPNEPARLSVRINVVVGPFDLGKLTIPVTADLRDDLGVSTHATLPTRYEGIGVSMRSMSIKLASSVAGKPFAVNPSKCQNNTVAAKLTSEGPSPSSVNRTKTITTVNCGGFLAGKTPYISVTPSTLQAGSPVGLRIDLNSPEGNPTIKRTEFTLPQNMGVNPAFGKAVVPCPTAKITAGDCEGYGYTTLADVTMTSPLLASKPQGRMYFESPGLTKDDRYRVAVIVNLPGRKLVVRGSIKVDGSTTIPSGGTGSLDQGTGQISADFDNIPDLGFTQLRLDFNAGSKAIAINPSECLPARFDAKYTPNSDVTKTSTSSTSYTPTGCVSSFDPTFSAIPSTGQAGGHPDFTMRFTNEPYQQERLERVNIKLPVGLVANTVATPRCTQASAAAGSCTAPQAVGEFSASIGATADSVDLSGGKIYNVVPNSNEPARLQAIIPVLVGPFDLGKLSLPVKTRLGSDMSVTAEAKLPSRYEGISVKVIDMTLLLRGTVGGNYFMVNPSRCATHTVTGEMISGNGLTSVKESTFTTTGCGALENAYNPSVSFLNTPKTAGAPTSFAMNVALPPASSTTSNVKVIFPSGLELSPGVGEGLLACEPAVIDAGGASCPATSRMASVKLTTPLLPEDQLGEIYIEPSIGNQASTRYRLAMVIHLPGQDLVIRSATLIDGSSDLIGGMGNKDSGDGHVTAEFRDLPDIGFTGLAVNFDGSRKLFVNPKTCGTFTVQSEMTPHAGPAVKKPTGTFQTEGGTCVDSGFQPKLTGSLKMPVTKTTATSGSNADLNLRVSNPDGKQELKGFSVRLPKGLVARTTGVPQCVLGDAQIGNCPAASTVGVAETTIGSGSETLTITGKIVNVVPDEDEPARLQAIVPVKVGPFDLGNFTVDVPTSLNEDLTVTVAATLPDRYEGIAVRVRDLNLTVYGRPAGGLYIVAPSKCGTSTIRADFTSNYGGKASDSFDFDVVGCPRQFTTNPQTTVSGSPAERNAPVNLTFEVANDADNPTVSKVRVELPDNMEVNPAFGEGLEACAPSVVDAGGDGCPASSKIGVVSVKTQLLDPNKEYAGDIYLETPGSTAATRFRTAVVAHLPGADLIVRGKISVAGSTDLQSGAGSTAYTGPGKIIAEFDEIPDLGFTSLKVSFNTNRPLLINPPSGGEHKLKVAVSPQSGGAPAVSEPLYMTSGDADPALFNPTFSAEVDNTASGGNPNFSLQVSRANNNSESIRDLKLELPSGLVARPVATSTRCSQANAAKGDCPAASRVGTLVTRFGNGATNTENLQLAGEIHNVVPGPDEPALLYAIVKVAVGPFDLGKLSIPVTTKLRVDAGIDTITSLPVRFEGIAVRIKQINITLNGLVDGKPFMQNPSACKRNIIRAHITSSSGRDTIIKQSEYTTTGCPLGFVAPPTVDVSVRPNETSVPSGLNVEVASDPANPTIGKIALKLPAGMSVNAAVGNGLVTCSTAQLDADAKACPLASKQGQVEVETPLLGETYTGSVYLEDPVGYEAETRYRVAIAIDLPGRSIVVHGRVLIDGATTFEEGGSGSIDTGTGQVTTFFDSVPDLSFSRFAIAFKTGPRALLTNPDTCGEQVVESTITPSSGGAAQAAKVNSSFTTSFDGNGAPCPESLPFDPTFKAQAADNRTGANTDLTLTVDSGSKEQPLRDFSLRLPAGLVADTDATNRCPQDVAAGSACGPDSLVGTVATEIGSGSETLRVEGSIHNVTPNSDEPARLAAIIPVEVGPYDLGRLSIQVPTSLRPGDYGVDTSTRFPLTYEGIRVRIRQLQLTLQGKVQPSNNGFIRNPSRCSAGKDAIEATMVSANGATKTTAADYPIVGCPRSFASKPTIAISDVSTEIERPTGLTLEIGSADDNPTIGRVTTFLPEGMALNPAVGNKIDACSTAAVDAGGDACPAGSIVGAAELRTPLLPGVNTGKVVLETPGTTAAKRYRIAVIVDLPGTNLIVRGVTEVDGSSDLPGDLGSTDESATGRVVAKFDDLPDINFSQLMITFDSGPDALLANSSQCGTQTVTAEFAPQSDPSAVVSSSDSYELSYDGAGAPCPTERGFDPSFTGEFSTNLAANNPDLTLLVSRDDKTEQLKRFDLKLSPGLVADTVSTPRCPLADAEAANCAPNTVVGSVKTTIGTGTRPLELSGNLHNVIPADLDSEPARFAAIFDVQIGPYDLGKLNIPVTTKIITGNEASDLAVGTETLVPQRYEGVPVRLRSIEIKLAGRVAGKPFMINPSRCGAHQIDARMTSVDGTVKNSSFGFTTAGCPGNFSPSIETEVPTTKAGVPSGFTFRVKIPSNSSTVRSVTTKLPVGFEINPGVGNRGGAGALKTCGADDINAGGAGCPASSRIGEVSLDTPLLPSRRKGNVYLEDPGSTPATRYKLAIVIDLPGPDLIVHGLAKVDGTGTGTNGGTGQVSATFDDLPDLQFSNLEVTFESGDAGDYTMLVSPKACGTYESTADLVAWSIAAGQAPEDAAVTRSDTVSIDDGCTSDFSPSFSAEVSDDAQAGSPDLRFQVRAGAMDERLRRLTIGLPVGLVANTTAAPRCSDQDLENGLCDPASKVGEVVTAVGAGSDPLSIAGDIYNVVPAADEPARLAAVVDAKVGPYNLGRLVIPVKTKIRSGGDPDPQRRFGIDTVTEVPVRFEGVAIQMRAVDLTVFGKVGGNRFVIAPSRCATHKVSAEFEGENGAKATDTDDFVIRNCADGFAKAPVISASVDPTETGKPTNFALSVDSDATNQTIGSVVTTLPAGMSINPAIGNRFTTETSACPTADIDAGDFSNCDAAMIGTVSLTTPLLPDVQTGKVYLEQPGSTPETRYRLAVAVELPGQRLVVRGRVEIDGTTALDNGLGSTDELVSGRLMARFEDVPDLGFTNLTVAFDTDERSLLINSDTCGPQTVEALITPTSGILAAAPTATFVTSYDGQGAPCPEPTDEPFDPTFNVAFSNTDAVGNPDMTIDITRQDKSQQFRKLDLELPPGLVANTVATPRCARPIAAQADCSESSRVGEIMTRIGSGDETLALTGGIYNVETISDDEPARLQAVLGVKVGPFNLGKLSVPVTTEIIGSTASTLRLLTHTTLPTRYEGIPARIREMRIKLYGKVAGKPFMINPSRCGVHTITAQMKSSLGAEHSGVSSYETFNCGNAPYAPDLTAKLRPDGRAGKPVGLDLGFSFDGSASSTRSVRTIMPVGMSINPGIGNLASGGRSMTCAPADIEAGGGNCPSTSRIGSVKLSTPLLPSVRSGSVYLETPGVGASERYRLGVYVSLPGSGLTIHGRARINGSSDLVDGLGSVNQGNGQVVAEFDDLPDLQFSDLQIKLNTTGGDDHALLTNPETCGGYAFRAQMVPWSRPVDDSIEISDSVTVDSCNGPEGPVVLTSSVSDLTVGEHADVNFAISRPDGNRGILSTAFDLPKGLVGSADAAPTCPDDASHAKIGVCDPSTLVGAVELSIGSSTDAFTTTGEIFNVEAPADRPAKFIFSTRVQVGPYDLGRVVVPIDVNVDPNEYYLSATTGNIPQRFEGIPVRVSTLRVKLFGRTADNKPFMSNPRSCGNALQMKAKVTFAGGASTNVNSSIGPFTGCQNLNLADNSIDITNLSGGTYEGRDLDRVPEAPTKLRVKVNQGTSPNQAGLKSMSMQLPGFRINAPAADGARVCTDAQLAARNCPSSSRVGTAWLDTALLPKNVPDPENVSSEKHSLWGAVYLITPGKTEDDRYRMALQMTGKTFITIRGTTRVIESGPNEGDIAADFNNLPDIPFEALQVDLDGVNDGSGLQPLLLNPENPSLTDPRTVAAGAAMGSWSDQPGASPVFKPSLSQVSVKAGTAKGFSPTTADEFTSSEPGVDPYQSGAHPNVKFTYTRPDGNLDIRNVRMSMPPGFVGSATAVPQCSRADAAVGECADSSKIGDVQVKVGQFGRFMKLSGSLYLTAGNADEIVGISIKLPAKAGDYDLGNYVAQGRVQIRPDDQGIDVDFRDVPRLFKGVPTHMLEMQVAIKGIIDGKPFFYNASSCEPRPIVTTMTAWDDAGTTSSQELPYQATGCEDRSFTPEISFTASGGSVDTPPAWTIKLGSRKGDSTMSASTIILPKSITINVAGIGNACTAEEVKTGCPARSKIGTVSINTPLLPTPIIGNVFMAKSISGASLPDLLLDIPAPINVKIRGASSFVNINQIKSTFSNLPDLVFNDITIQIAGGPKGLIMLRRDGVCGPGQADFGAQAGQRSAFNVAIRGIEGFCGEQEQRCLNPNVKIKTFGGRDKNPDNDTATLSLSTDGICKSISSAKVIFPKGTKFSGKDLTVKAGYLKLGKGGFKTSGSSLNFVTPFPADQRALSIKSKSGGIELPYKKFCGDVQKDQKALAKCRKKKITFTFVITNSDGSSYRYKFAAPAGSKFFK